MFKEKNLVFKAGGEVPMEGAQVNTDHSKIDFSADAPDPRPKAAKIDNPNYKPGLLTKNDINIEDDNGVDVLKFGGDRNAVTGKDVYELLGVSDVHNCLEIDVTIDNASPLLASWDGRQYIYQEGSHIDKPVRFLNGKNYIVSSAKDRLNAIPDRSDASTTNTTEPAAKPVGRLAALSAQRGYIDATVNADLAKYAQKDVETPPSPEMLAMREKMAAKDAENARIRQELEAKYLREGEKPGEVALSFLKMRHENAEREAKAEQARKEFPTKLPDSSVVGNIAGARKLKLDNGRFALYFDTTGQTIVPGADGRNMAIYDKDDRLESVKDFYELRPETQEKLKKLNS